MPTQEAKQKREVRQMVDHGIFRFGSCPQEIVDTISDLEDIVHDINHDIPVDVIVERIKARLDTLKRRR